MLCYHTSHYIMLDYTTLHYVTIHYILLITLQWIQLHFIKLSNAIAYYDTILCWCCYSLFRWSNILKSACIKQQHVNTCDHCKRMRTHANVMGTASLAKQTIALLMWTSSEKMLRSTADWPLYKVEDIKILQNLNC